jgi:hypothetical protein
MDFLTLHTGKKFEVPFDVLTVFATNLDPLSLADEAFLRRIPTRSRWTIRAGELRAHLRAGVPAARADLQPEHRRLSAPRTLRAGGPAVPRLPSADLLDQVSRSVGIRGSRRQSIVSSWMRLPGVFRGQLRCQPPITPPRPQEHAAAR